MPIRAIFFDAGNTLLYPRVDELVSAVAALGYLAGVEDFYAAERQAKKAFDAWLWPKLEQHDLPPAVDRVYWVEYLKILFERVRVPVVQHDNVTRQLVERFRDIRLWSRVFPDTEPVLQSLQASGYSLGVISNSVGTIEEQLGRAGLGSYFRFVLDSAVVGVEKPHPEIFQMALDRAAVPPAEAVFIGDTYATDIGGARGAGIRGVLIDRFGAYDDAVDCPRITSLSALEPVLSRLGAGSPPNET
jgi:putative hydrolase of the HAD superfamily